MRINAIGYQFNTLRSSGMGYPTKQNAAVANKCIAANQNLTVNQRREMKQQLKGTNAPVSNMPANSILDSSMNYLNSLREARNKTKNTNLEKKKLKYSYKAISSKIINCKKSYKAREVVGQAKREVARLKKLRSKGGYDSEELEAAIGHAQAMERVAKKKARHLQEEELVKAAGGAFVGELEEREDTESSGNEDLESKELSEEELMQLEQQEYIEESDFEDIALADINDMVNDMLDEMSEELASLMEEMGLDELLDGMDMTVDRDMDPADLKMLTIKHRSKEMKDIAEADGEYLKAVFDILEKQKAAATAAVRTDAPAMSFATSGGGMEAAVLANLPTVDTPAISIDISI